MKLIAGKVYSHLSIDTGEKNYVKDVRRSGPRSVSSFSELVELVAKISFNNPEYALFYRGQPEDFRVNPTGSTIMPSLYRLNGVGRGTRQSKRLVEKNFIKLKKENGNVLLKVFDKGIGIPSDEISHIFDRFYRSKQKLEFEARGSGLGLTRVKHVVDSHGGKIKVESKPGEGSTFSIEFPIIRSFSGNGL